MLVAIVSMITILAITGTRPVAESLAKNKTTISCGKNFFYSTGSLEEISISDNRKSAGEFKSGIYYIDLETRSGNWFPETHEGTAITVYAFAEKGKPLQVPGPLIRVPQGTLIHATITNNIKEHELVLFGFITRPGNAGDSIVIQPGETKTIQFNAGTAGTYFYKAYATDSIFDGMPWNIDSQLYGAFIVDPPNHIIDTAERIFVIGMWNDSLNGPYKGGEELAMNGLSWPFTEKLTYTQYEPVHWRVINASNQSHPMHLHGFFYRVTSRGTIDKDVILDIEKAEEQVTELLDPSHTMRMTWVAERDGNWLFHCHLFFHILPESFLRTMADTTAMEIDNITTHAHNGMGGLIMGIHVNRSGKDLPQLPEKGVAERQLTMFIHNTMYNDTVSGIGFKLLENGKTLQTGYTMPGPPIVLYKNEPVAIKVINQLPEQTTVHWHGMQIESYFDGVAGWGYRDSLLAPLIAPGDSFTVHMNPSRAGTYMYHTHMHNFQLLFGMSGPLIVLNKGETFSSATDKTFFINETLDTLKGKLDLFVNGSNRTDTTQLVKGKNYRLRFMNISADATDINVSVLHNNKPVDWRYISRDGSDILPNQRTTKTALKQTVSIGQTFDFEFTPKDPGNYTLEFRCFEDAINITKIFSVN